MLKYQSRTILPIGPNPDFHPTLEVDLTNANIRIDSQSQLAIIERPLDVPDGVEVNDDITYVAPLDSNGNFKLMYPIEYFGLRVSQKEESDFLELDTTTPEQALILGPFMPLASNQSSSHISATIMINSDQTYNSNVMWPQVEIPRIPTEGYTLDLRNGPKTVSQVEREYDIFDTYKYKVTFTDDSQEIYRIDEGSLGESYQTSWQESHEYHIIIRNNPVIQAIAQESGICDPSKVTKRELNEVKNVISQYSQEFGWIEKNAWASDTECLVFLRKIKSDLKFSDRWTYIKTQFVSLVDKKVSQWSFLKKEIEAAIKRQKLINLDLPQTASEKEIEARRSTIYSLKFLKQNISDFSEIEWSGSISQLHNQIFIPLARALEIACPKLGDDIAYAALISEFGQRNLFLFYTDAEKQKLSEKRVNIYEDGSFSHFSMSGIYEKIFANPRSLSEISQRISKLKEEYQLPINATWKDLIKTVYTQAYQQLLIDYPDWLLETAPSDTIIATLKAREQKLKQLIIERLGLPEDSTWEKITAVRNKGYSYTELVKNNAEDWSYRVHQYHYGKYKSPLPQLGSFLPGLAGVIIAIDWFSDATFNSLLATLLLPSGKIVRIPLTCTEGGRGNYYWSTYAKDQTPLFHETGLDEFI